MRCKVMHLFVTGELLMEILVQLGQWLKQLVLGQIEVQDTIITMVQLGMLRQQFESNRLLDGQTLCKWC